MARDGTILILNMKRFVPPRMPSLLVLRHLLTQFRPPLLTLSKSGGLRFSCRVLDYLHPNIEQERLYIYKDTVTPRKSNQRDVYLEILGEEGYSRWDARYEILLGNLLESTYYCQRGSLRAY